MRWLAAPRRTKSMVDNDAKCQVVTTTSPTTRNVVDVHHTSASLPQRQQNTVFRALPDDILVFIWELAIFEESKSGFFPSYDHLALLKISAVCQHWRWTALNTPSLWTHIRSRFPPDLLNLFLKRSMEAPLNVEITCDKYFDDNLHPSVDGDDLMRKVDKFSAKLAAILRHSNRIRFLSLSLEAYASTIIDSRLAGANCRTPMLEGLRFHVTSDLGLWAIPNVDLERIVDAGTSLLEKFRSPLLRELYLDGLRAPPDYIHLASLSHLSLKFNDVEKSVEDYLTSILVDEAPLISLSLDLWSAFVISQPSGSTANRLHLPHLRVLSLKAPFSQCMHLSAMFSVESLEELHLETRQSFIVVHELAKLLPRNPPGESARIEFDADLIRLEFFNMTEGSRCDSYKKYLFSLNTQFSNDSTIYILLGILKSHHFPNILSVDLRSSGAFDSGVTRALLSHFDTLRSLRIHLDRRSTCVFPIEDAIGSSLLRSPSSPLRSVQSLTFSNLTVKIPQAMPFLLELSTVVHERTKAGLPPLILEFENCEGVTDELLRNSGLKR
ncbi:hypothetical protein SCHPADRAFT_329178 [Schizopora paradoxa]|uniref:Uncharacterized protein n=1 Tax=Schizopora paradoxa TaxID=27342 RepID=A0A0H2RXC6_9AGAM|nr:hypothetical protein SCHPADRAFT_329178 [Schizopora paradoxa]